MASPLLYQIVPFDAKSAFDFVFSYSASQIFKNRLIVKNNVTNVTVYDVTTESRQLLCELPANTLVNGTAYNAQLSVFDSSNNESTLSNIISFTCYAMPVLIFSNLVANQVLDNSYYTFTLSYTQAQDRILNNYKMTLYNSNSSEIFNTGTIYNTTSLSQIIKNFDNNTNYFVKGDGETVDGMTFTTGLVRFNVQYITPVVFSMIEPENMPLLGEVKITSNLLSIDGWSNPDPPTYIGNNLVDLSTPNTWVIFDKGFDLTNNFLLQINLRSLTPNQMFAEFSNSLCSFQLYYMESTFSDSDGLVGYINLKTKGNALTYTINSQYIKPMSIYGYIYNIWIRKVNNIYDLKVASLSITIDDINAMHSTINDIIEKDVHIATFDSDMQNII